MLTATVGKSLITKGYCKRLRTHSRRSERPKIMGVWRCKVSLRYGIRNNVGLYRCRLCGGDVFLSVSRHFRPEGEHTIAVEDLFAGYFETVLAKNELIAELQIPAQGKTRAAYLKVTTGSAEDWPALGVAVAIEGDSSGVKSIRVVVSAAAEKAVRLKAAEKTLSGATIDDKTLARAGDAAADEAECISDVRGSAAYKRELLRVYVARAVRQAISSNGATH
jgi:hypothetical protein